MTVDVLVLGAGMAGLAAARTLVRHGARVIVLEARSRVGGRVCSTGDPMTPVPIELGAEFLHGEAEATQTLARELAIGVQELEGSRWLKTGGRLACVKDYDARLGRLLGRVFAHVRTGRDRSFGDALARTSLRAEDRELVASFVEGFHGGAIDRISARILARGGAEGPGRLLRIASGYSALAEGMAASVADALRFGRTITSVRWRRGHVVVTATGPTRQAEVFRARTAIVALPLGVLQSGSIAFEPALDRAHERALASLAMGDVVKITLRFREPFWLSGKRAGASIFHAPRAAVPTFWTTRPVRAPVIVAWAGGPAADKLAHLSRTDIAEIAVDALADTLGCKRDRIHRLVDAFWVHDWRRDPLSLGAYSYALVGAESAARTLARSIEHTLHFCGEHTVAPPENGTVEGAIESGLRAAAHALTPPARAAA